RRAAEAAPTAPSAADTEADIRLGAVTLFDWAVFAGAHIHDRQHHVCRLAADRDVGKDRARATADEAAEDAADVSTARIVVLRRDVRNENVVGGLHLALADIRSLLQVAARRELTFLLRHLKALAAIDQREAAGLAHEDLQQNFRRGEV